MQSFCRRNSKQSQRKSYPFKLQLATGGKQEVRLLAEGLIASKLHNVSGYMLPLSTPDGGKHSLHSKPSNPENSDVTFVGIQFHSDKLIIMQRWYKASATQHALSGLISIAANQGPANRILGSRHSTLSITFHVKWAPSLGNETIKCIFKSLVF